MKCEGPVTPGTACAPGPSPCPCARPGPGPCPCAGRVWAERAGPEPTSGGTELMPVKRGVLVGRRWLWGQNVCGERMC